MAKNDLPPQPIKEHEYAIQTVESPDCQFKQVGDYFECTSPNHHHGAYLPGYELKQVKGKQVIRKIGK